MQAGFVDYGHQTETHWVKLRTCCQLLLLVGFSAFCFFSLFGGVYIPYLEAVERRTEIYLEAKKYTESRVCTDETLIKELGRHGLKNCAQWAKTLELDIQREAGRDVLNKFNLCKDGECVVLTFNLITLVTTFLPLTLIAFGLFVLLVVGAILYNAYTATLRNNELPLMMMMAAKSLHAPREHLKAH